MNYLYQTHVSFGHIFLWRGRTTWIYWASCCCRVTSYWSIIYIGAYLKQIFVKFYIMLMPKITSLTTSFFKLTKLRFHVGNKRSRMHLCYLVCKHTEPKLSSFSALSINRKVHLYQLRLSTVALTCDYNQRSKHCARVLIERGTWLCHLEAAWGSVSHPCRSGTVECHSI